MKTYYTTALDSDSCEITHRLEHDSAKAARAWMKENKTAPGYWDRTAERDGFHREVASIALFADDEQIDEIETNFPAAPEPTDQPAKAAALADFLFNRALQNGEPCDPRDLAAVAAEWSRDNSAGQLDAATIATANRRATERFVNSMVRNELDTEAENRTDIPPLASRIARWEALRPAPESVNLTPGEVRFLLWVIPQADCDRAEGMAAWVAMGGAIALAAKLRAAFPTA